MKSKFKLMALLFLMGFFATGLKAVAEEKTKEYHQEWAASSVESLEVINKFGEVKVTNNGGSQVTIDVVVTVEAANSGKANELLGLINVDFAKSGSTVKAETKIDSDFKSRMKFSIDYTINIPSDKNLKISNKYGNTAVNVLNANGDFDIQYGNFKGNELNAPGSANINFSLAYGKAEVGSINNLNLDIKYSNMNVDGLGNLKAESKYSVLKVSEAKVLQIDSKYDTFEFEEVQSLTATTKYSHISIEELKKYLKVEAGYGGISVGEVSKGFESIWVENSYGQIKLGLNEQNYSLDASCDYCGISYPESSFKGNKIKENHTQTVDGKVGSGEGGKVYIRSRYGEIKLQ